VSRTARTSRTSRTARITRISRQKKAGGLVGVSPRYRLQALYISGEMNNNWVVGGIDRYLNPIENKQKKSEPDKPDYPEFRIKTQHIVLHTLNRHNICYH
jgi:hypothetical protein